MRFKHKDVVKGATYITLSLLMAEIFGLLFSALLNGLDWERLPIFMLSYLGLTAALALQRNHKFDKKSLAFAYRLSPLLLVYWAVVAKSGIGTLSEIVVGVTLSLLIVIGLRSRALQLSKQVL